MHATPPAAIATSEPLAARAGHDALLAGGSAVDAALAAAICLTVTEPTSNGLGGDLFALVYDGAVHALDATGVAPARLTPALVAERGHARMPRSGWLPVTVPGQVRGWEALHARFGELGWDRLFRDAVRHARDGFAVSPRIAAAWARSRDVFVGFSEWRRVFLPGGTAPRAGEAFGNPDLAASLEVVSRDGASGFYTTLGARIAAHAAATGGVLGFDDLSAYRAQWVDPLSVRFGPWQVVGMGPPSQGAVALAALALVDGLHGVHAEIEAMKLAFADGYAALGDPARSRSADMLDPARLADRRSGIGPTAGPSPAASGLGGGTVLVCAGDGAGRLCALIQSNYMGFGSGIVVPGTGIALQNRGAGFSLDPDHPAALAPGRKPFHTLMPGLLLGDRAAAYGCMGGQMQPQGHVQVVRALAAGATPQQAVSAPRWRWMDEGHVLLEAGFDTDVAGDLERRGHRIVRGAHPRHFGGAQVVMRADDGWSVGTDPRKDGHRATH